MAALAVRRERQDTTQCTVRGAFVRRRIRDRGFSPRAGRNGLNWFPTPLNYPVLTMQYLTTSRMFVGRGVTAYGLG